MHGLPVLGAALSFTALCAWAASSGSPFRRRVGGDPGGDRCGVLERHRCRSGTRADRLLLRGALAQAADPSATGPSLG